MRIALLPPRQLAVREPLADPLARQVVLLAVGLREAGHTVTLYTGAEVDDALLSSGARKAKRRRRGGLAIARWPRCGSDGAAAPSLLKTLRVDRPEAVLDLSGDPEVVTELTRAGLPTVHVVHALPTRALVDACREAIRGRGRVTVTSTFAARRWRPYLDDFQVIVNGVDLDAWRYSSRPVPGLCAYVGPVGEADGVDLALAAARLAGRQMVLAGPVADESFFRERIEPLLDRERRYLGVLGTLASAQLLSNAECCSLTPRELNPVAYGVAESLACGTPIVGFDSGAARALLDEHSGILVPDGDVDRLARAMARAPSLARSACRHQAAEFYSGAAMIESYGHALASVVRATPRRRSYAGIVLGGNRPAISGTVG